VLLTALDTITINLYPIVGSVQAFSLGFFMDKIMNTPTPTEQRRIDYFAGKQAEFDLNADDRKIKIDWIDSVIMPMLED